MELCHQKMNMALENSMHPHLTAPLGLHRPKIKDDYGMFFSQVAPRSLIRW